MSTVKFSDGNTKMGKIPSVSLPAIKTFLICQKHKIESKFSKKPMEKGNSDKGIPANAPPVHNTCITE